MLFCADDIITTRDNASCNNWWKSLSHNHCCPEIHPQMLQYSVLLASFSLYDYGYVPIHVAQISMQKQSSSSPPARSTKAPSLTRTNSLSERWKRSTQSNKDSLLYGRHFQSWHRLTMFNISLSPISPAPGCRWRATLYSVYLSP